MGRKHMVKNYGDKSQNERKVEGPHIVLTLIQVIFVFTFQILITKRD